MRKGIEAVEEQIERCTPTWEREGYWDWEQQYMHPAPEPPREPERSLCTCAPWATYGWDGPDHDCPTHGCGVQLR